MADVVPRVSECTICPPWVIQCAHFDGQIEIISDRHLYPSEAGCGYCAGGWTGARFLTWRVLGEWSPCPGCAIPGVRTEQDTRDFLSFPDLASAQEEFRRREEALLRPAQPAPPPTR